jgi:phosphate transport system protein
MVMVTRSQPAHAQPHDDDLDSLHRRVCRRGTQVIDRLEQSLRALRDGDTVTARGLLTVDRATTDVDVLIDDESVEALIRGGCVAGNLRAIICISKAVTDLERIEEQAVRLAEETLHLYERRYVHPGRQLIRDAFETGHLALDLLRGALGSFEALSASRARRLACCQRDLAVVMESVLTQAAEFLARDPRNVGQTIQLMLMMTDIERIGEHACDLAGYVYYMVRGSNREPCGSLERARESVPEPGVQGPASTGQAAAI